MLCHFRSGHLFACLDWFWGQR
uniref:Uncharacterized protein n=1 Tax=Arundo donax TaxID=35708 RepID=A0A0A9BJF2_ARUDO